MWGRTAMSMVKRLEVCLACVAFGAVYGLVLGALVGTCIFPLLGTVIGGIIGLGYGCAGGCLAGVIGTAVGGRLGWCLAGVVGGLAPAAAIWSGFGKETGLLLFIGIPGVFVASLLGLAISLGLRSGKSSVPGVSGLIAVITDAQPPEGTTRALGLPTELMPCALPEGRGDEATPVGPPASY